MFFNLFFVEAGPRSYLSLKTAASLLPAASGVRASSTRTLHARSTCASARFRPELVRANIKNPSLAWRAERSRGVSSSRGCGEGGGGGRDGEGGKEERGAERGEDGVGEGGRRSREGKRKR